MRTYVLFCRGSCDDYDVDSRDRQQQASLDERLAATCGRLNACYAELVELVAEVIASDAWQGWGIRSIEQWITWRTGLAAGHARALIALATAAEAHPQVCGVRRWRMSIDQAALAVRAGPSTTPTSPSGRAMTLPQLRIAVRAQHLGGGP